MSFDKVQPSMEDMSQSNDLFVRLAAESPKLRLIPADLDASNAAGRIINGLSFTAGGTAIGTGAGIGAGWVTARTMEGLGQGLFNLVEPFIGPRFVSRIPFSSYAGSFGWRGAVVGAAIGLLAYGGYEGYKAVFGKSEP